METGGAQFWLSVDTICTCEIQSWLLKANFHPQGITNTIATNYIQEYCKQQLTYFWEENERLILISFPAVCNFNKKFVFATKVSATKLSHFHNLYFFKILFLLFAHLILFFFSYSSFYTIIFSASMKDKKQEEIDSLDDITAMIRNAVKGSTSKNTIAYGIHYEKNGQPLPSNPEATGISIFQPALFLKPNLEDPCRGEISNTVENAGKYFVICLNN